MSTVRAMKEKVVGNRGLSCKAKMHIYPHISISSMMAELGRTTCDLYVFLTPQPHCSKCLVGQN